MNVKKQNVGHQLTSIELHQRQQEQEVSHPAPLVIGVGLVTPANIGSIFRISDAVGSERIIFVDTQVSKEKKLERISRSTSKVVPHVFLTQKEFIEQASGLPDLVALEITSKSSDIFLTDLPQDMAFVVGGERHGIPEEILQLCICAVHIPMFGINSSMNVATSLGIAMYVWHNSYR